MKIEPLDIGIMETEPDKLDCLIREIFEAADTYYVEHQAAEIRKLIQDFMVERLNEEGGDGTE